MNAAASHTPKLDSRTTGSEQCFLRQRKAATKKRMLGRIPQRAPFVKSCMITGSPLFSTYIHTRTRAPVSGMTPIRPAVDGNFFPTAVAIRMMTTLRTTLITICIVYFLVQRLSSPAALVRSGKAVRWSALLGE